MTAPFRCSRSLVRKWGPEPGQDRPSVLGGDGTNGSPATGWPRYNRVAAQPAAYVGPGQVSWFQFQIQAPQLPGTYRLAIRALVEGAQWLEDYGVFWYVTVKTSDAPPPPVTTNPPPAQTIASGVTLSLVKVFAGENYDGYNAASYTTAEFKLANSSNSDFIARYALDDFSMTGNDGVLYAAKLPFGSNLQVRTLKPGTTDTFWVTLRGGITPATTQLTVRIAMFSAVSNLSYTWVVR